MEILHLKYLGDMSVVSESVWVLTSILVIDNFLFM